MKASPSALIHREAPAILAEIEKATSILLHCHPSPDPDSVGSALAMMLAVRGLGKTATVLSGDSAIPEAFKHFPGAADIVPKAFLEADLSAFDLFIILDSGGKNMVSRRGAIAFPPSLRTVNIDHHATNERYADVNLVEESYPSCTQVLYDLFLEWGIEISPGIAANLFIGTYTDTGGFKFPKTTWRTLAMAAELARIAPDFPELIAGLENANKPESLYLLGAALDSIETFAGGRVAISSVSNETLALKKIAPEDISTHSIASFLRTIVGWDVDVSLVEVEPNKVKASFRTRDDTAYDLTKIARAFGGGGHRAAAGATLDMPIADAKAAVAAKAQELYNL